MARQPQKNPRGTQSPNASKAESAEHLFEQMESLQRELLILAQRAEVEVESALTTNPLPILEMLQQFAEKAGADSGCVWFAGSQGTKTEIAGLKSLELEKGDTMQCDLALSGREMAFDFMHARVFLPVVVFDNPLAVAVFSLPGLSCANYEEVCRYASEGICKLRKKLRPVQSTFATDLDTAS